ncbi:MAG: T9SS type A sorting domain-containing protein [Chitinophagaceae bacterium]|nr:T9SS type A sorting domain-containing protein [Chitinophagaceae bacterium]
MASTYVFNRLIVLCIAVFGFGVIYGQPYQVGHVTKTFTDAARSNRSVPVEIFYPADVAGDNKPFAAAYPGKAPVISFGHGFVMTYDAYANIRDAVVANGYIIAFPTTEGSFSPSHSEFGKDLAFVLREVTALGAQTTSVLYGKTDTNNCVMGHSMGGGAAFLARSYDASIKAMVTFAAAETTPSAISAASSVKAPSLVFAGENDCVTAPSTNQRPMYDALTAACKHYITIKGGSHCQMAGASTTCSFGEATCTPAPGITRAAQHATINKYLIPWLNYTLKGNCPAGTAFETDLAADGAVTYAKNCTLCSPTGVGVDDPEKGVSVYPNPASDKIVVRTDGKATSRIFISQVAGRVVYDGHFIGSLAIPSSSFPAGVYLYQISDGEANTVVGRLVISH